MFSGNIVANLCGFELANMFEAGVEKNNVVRNDGTSSSNRAKITNISVSDNYTTYNENGYKVIKIGDSDKILTGSHTYTIKYTYDIGKDTLKDSDEFYYNIIGDEWDASINTTIFS